MPSAGLGDCMVHAIVSSRHNQHAFHLFKHQSHRLATPNHAMAVPTGAVASCYEGDGARTSICCLPPPL